VSKETPAEKLTEANCHARLISSKQLLNDVIFVWFSHKKAIHISSTEKFTERPTVSILLQQRIKTSKQNAFFAQE